MYIYIFSSVKKYLVSTLKMALSTMEPLQLLKK